MPLPPTWRRHPSAGKFSEHRHISCERRSKRIELCVMPPQRVQSILLHPPGVIGHRAVLPCSVPVVPSFLFSFFFFHTVVFSFPGRGWIGSVLCLTFLDRPGPGRGLDLLSTLSFSFAVSFQRTRRRESERNGERGRQRQRERERKGREKWQEKGGGHGRRGVTGGEPGGAREDERSPDSSIPKWMSLEKSARVDAPNTEGKERMNDTGKRKEGKRGTEWSRMVAPACEERSKD